MLDAILPIKSLALAKTRLAHMLSSDERRGLALAMLEDVLRSLRASQQIEHIHLLGRDPEALRLARLYAAEWLFDSTRDLNSALRLGARHATERGAQSLLLLHADVPLISAADIERMTTALDGPSSLALAAARDGGTNALACSAPLPIPLCFGRRSMAMHLEVARRRGIHAQLVYSPTLRDIDRPEDLIWLMEQSGQSLAHDFVRGLGVIERAACA